jgi:hypothetical protein
MSATFFYCEKKDCQSRCYLYEKVDAEKRNYLYYYCERCLVAYPADKKTVYSKQYGVLKSIASISHYEYDVRLQRVASRCDRCGKNQMYVKQSNMSFVCICDCSQS